MSHQMKQLQTCDVCRLLDKDTLPKLCTYCFTCDSWLCDRDRVNLLRRARAAVRRRLEPGYRGK